MIVSSKIPTKLFLDFVKSSSENVVEIQGSHRAVSFKKTRQIVFRQLSERCRCVKKSHRVVGQLSKKKSSKNSSNHRYEVHPIGGELEETHHGY